MRGQDEEAVGAMISKKLADPGFAFHPVHPGSNHLFNRMNWMGESGIHPGQLDG